MRPKHSHEVIVPNDCAQRQRVGIEPGRSENLQFAHFTNTATGPLSEDKKWPALARRQAIKIKSAMAIYEWVGSMRITSLYMT
jgi:hypothetical protein